MSTQLLKVASVIAVGLLAWPVKDHEIGSGMLVLSICGLYFAQLWRVRRRRS